MTNKPEILRPWHFYAVHVVEHQGGRVVRILSGHERSGDAVRASNRAADASPQGAGRFLVWQGVRVLENIEFLDVESALRFTHVGQKSGVNSSGNLQSIHPGDLTGKRG